MNPRPTSLGSNKLNNTPSMWFDKLNDLICKLKKGLDSDGNVEALYMIGRSKMNERSPVMTPVWMLLDVSVSLKMIEFW